MDKNKFSSKDKYYYLSKYNKDFQEIEDCVKNINTIVDVYNIKLQTSNGKNQMISFFEKCNFLKVLKKEYKQGMHSKNEYTKERDSAMDKLWLIYCTSEINRPSFDNLVYKWVDIFSQLDGYTFVKKKRTNEEILDAVIEIEDLFNTGKIKINSEESLGKFYIQFEKYIEMAKINLIQIDEEIRNFVINLFNLLNKRKDNEDIDLFFSNMELRNGIYCYSPYYVLKALNLETDYYNKRQIDIGSVKQNMKYFTYLNTNFKKIDNPDLEKYGSYQVYLEEVRENKKYKDYPTEYTIIDCFYSCFIHSLVIALELYLKCLYIELAKKSGCDNKDILRMISKTVSHDYIMLIKEIENYGCSNINVKLDSIKDVVSILNDRKSLENLRYNIGYLNDLTNKKYFDLFLFLYNEYMEMEYDKRNNVDYFI